MNRQTKRQMARQGSDQPRAPEKRSAPNPQVERTGPKQYFSEVRGEMKKVAWPPRPEIMNSSLGRAGRPGRDDRVDLRVRLGRGAHRQLRVQVMVGTFELPPDDDGDGDDMTSSETQIPKPRSPRRRRRAPRPSRPRATRSLDEPKRLRRGDASTRRSSRFPISATPSCSTSKRSTTPTRSRRSPSRARSTGPAVGTSCTRTPATRTR